MLLSEHLALDQGFKSRKMWVIVLSLFLVAVVDLLSYKLPAISALYSTFCGTVVSLVTLYIGGNSAVKWMAIKQSQGENSAPKT
jgi:hypothetical protein